MKTSSTQTRLNSKKALVVNTNKPKVRRCEIKLRRFKISRQENCELQEQQNDQENLHKTPGKGMPGVSLQKLKKCVVKLRRINLETDSNKTTPVPSMAPLRHNPSLSLTKRRAKELGLKKPPKICEKPKSPNNDALDGSGDKTIFEKMCSAKSISPRNLVNQSSAIEELLLFGVNNENDDNVQKNSNDDQTNISRKFFHNDHKNISKNNYLIGNKNKIVGKKKIAKKNANTNPTIENQQQKRRNVKCLTSAATSTKNDIYEFLSQSQSSDSDGHMVKHKDVASDIIKKMVKEGKVVVTKNYKGRPRVKPRPVVRKRQQNTKKKQIEHNTLNIQNEEFHNNVSDDEQHLDAPALSNVASNVNEKINADSTFSELARSVLVRKVDNHRKVIADGKTALKILQRYNSTPFKPQQQSSPQLPAGEELSPIRLNEKSKISHYSNKNRPIENSPPSNQTINSTNQNYMLPTMKSMSLSSVAQGREKSLHVASSSSFSSNDSNAENLPPPSTTRSAYPTSLKNQALENDFIHSARQSPNPRRNLPHRSPLQSIKITDIVILPPYTGPLTADNANNKTVDNSMIKNKSNAESKLFGFEEYLDKDDENDTFNHTTANQSLPHVHNKSNANSSTSNIGKHLKRLKRLRPKIIPISRRSANSTITKNIFNDGVNSNKSHRNIKEMLCSTMINNKSLKEQTACRSSLAAHSDSDEDSDAAVPGSKSYEKKTAELFGDPETTLDQKSFHRTYERPFKRKRKLLHPFSDIFASDDEQSENDVEVDHHNSSFAKERGRQAKKRHAESPAKDELNKFVLEFNSMLKEAEDYELIVE